jgi:cytochrome c
LTEIAKKYPGKVDYLAVKIKAGGSGVWGAIPMPAQDISEADAKIIANWLANGAPK